MESQRILNDLARQAIQTLLLAAKAVFVAILLFGLIIDGGTAGASYLQAKSAANLSAAYGVSLLEAGIEGPLSVALLDHIEAHGATLVSYKVLYKSKKADALWVQARTITPLPFLGLLGIDRVTLVASGKAKLPAGFQLTS